MEGRETIKEKRCTVCKEIKGIRHFHKNRNANNGYKSSCAECCNELKRKKSKTKIGRIQNMYLTQRVNSKLRGHAPPTYTVYELMHWIVAQPGWKEMFQAWIDSGWNMELCPTCNRLDDDKGYSFSNIELMTQEDNNKDEHEKLKRGEIIQKKTKKKITSPNPKLFKKVKVEQWTLDGKFIELHDSVSIAGKVVRVSSGHISAVCRNKRKTSGGYKWKYHKEIKE